MDRQALPAGYGFALLNRDGRTLYHSDRRLSLRENFLDELSEAAVARSMIYEGRSDRFRSRYRERPHELYLKEIPLNLADGEASAGFHIIAFRDTSVERALAGRALVRGLLGPMVLLIAIFATGLSGLVLAARVFHTRWSAWLWPHGGLSIIYRRQALVLLALLTVGVAVSMSTGSAGVFVPAPVLAATLCIAISVHGRPSSGSRCRLSSGGWPTFAFVLLLLCLVVIPSAALFRLVLGHEFAKMISTERAWIEAQQLDAITAAEVEAVDERYAPSKSAKRERAEDRRVYFSCVPAPYDAEVVGPPDLVSPIPGTSMKPCGRPEAGSRSGVRPARLLYNRLDAFIVRAMQRRESDLPIRNDIVARQRFQDKGLTYVPAGPLLWSSSGVALVGFGFAIGLLVWWLRWNMNRLFFANEQTAEPIASIAEAFKTLWKMRTRDEQMVLLQVARERIANPYQGDVVRRLLGEGLLRLGPDLQPSSQAFDEFLLRKETECQARIVEWENVNAGHSWRYVRLIPDYGGGGARIVSVCHAACLSVEPGRRRDRSHRDGDCGSQAARRRHVMVY